MAKILVVDNEKEIVDLYYDLLTKKGFKVLTAANGKDCLSIAERESPDLILLDVMMPGMDGGEAAQNLLENEKTKGIPIIFLTSIITREEEIEQMGRIAGRTFVSKAGGTDSLLKKINEVLGIGA